MENKTNKGKLTDKTVNAKPIQKFRCGQITTSIWKNKSKEGKDFLSFTLQKSYKDGDEWKQTASYSSHDLICLEYVLRKTTEFIFVDYWTEKNAEDSDEE